MEGEIWNHGDNRDEKRENCTLTRQTGNSMQLVKYGKIHCWFIATSSVDNSFRSLLPNSLFDVICIFTFIYKTYTWTRIVTFSRAMFLHSFNSNKNNKLCISKYKLEKQLLDWGGYDNHSLLIALKKKSNELIVINDLTPCSFNFFLTWFFSLTQYLLFGSLSKGNKLFSLCLMICMILW